MSDPQMRKVLLTINNPLEKGFTHETIKDILLSRQICYFCMADEVGENGTYHTHIYFLCNTSIRFSTVKKLFPFAHIDPGRGTSKDIRDYILKTGKWASTKKADTTVEGTFEEWGELPSESKEKSPVMHQVRQEFLDGMTVADIVYYHPNLSLRISQLEVLRQTLLSEKYSKEFRNVTVTYVFGKTGTGKTSGIYASHEIQDICRITSYKGDRILFDSYSGQSVLVLEEFRGQIALAELLSILDKYPLMLPARYHDKVACYTTVYLVSNVSLYSLYPTEQKYEVETWYALLRRISVIREYKSIGLYDEYSPMSRDIPQSNSYIDDYDNPFLEMR